MTPCSQRTKGFHLKRFSVTRLVRLLFVLLFWDSLIWPTITLNFWSSCLRMLCRSVVPRLYSFGECAQGFIHTRQAPYQLSCIPRMANFNYPIKNTSQQDNRALSLFLSFWILAVKLASQVYFSLAAKQLFAFLFLELSSLRTIQLSWHITFTIVQVMFVCYWTCTCSIAEVSPRSSIQCWGTWEHTGLSCLTISLQ